MGASNQSIRSGADPNVVADPRKSGQTVDPGPYVAEVISHIKSTRMGQLGVWIPDWGEKPDPANPSAIVSYSSPFYGTTYGTDTQQLPNSPASAGQSYGMWMVPPDIGAKVLVIFATGDIGKGYWIGCVYDSPSHHMVPGLARNIGGSNNTTSPGGELAGYLNASSNLPVTEYSTADATGFDSDALVNTKRPAHIVQTSILVAQGLDKDKVRGAISSSSMREVPSNVYGISTPGRRATKGDQFPSNPDAVAMRTGGHQFVMDDGDKDGVDQLIRLRTAGGHQILMNDTESVLYIASKSGLQYIEFSTDGQIHVYGRNGMNFRTEGVMNFHADAEINFQSQVINMKAASKKAAAIIMNSTGSISMSSMMGLSAKSNGPVSVSSLSMASFKAGGLVSISAGASCSVSGLTLLLNCAAGAVASGLTAATSLVGPGKSAMHPDTKRENGVWYAQENGIESVCSIVPAHEPWVGPDGKSRPSAVFPGKANALGF